MAKRAKKEQEVEPLKTLQEVAGKALDNYLERELPDQLGPALWELLDSYDSPLFTVSPDTDDSATIRPVMDRLMLERHHDGTRYKYRLVQWADARDELAREGD